MSTATLTERDADAPAPEAPVHGRELVTRLAGLVLGTAAVVALIVVLGGWAWVLVIASVIAIVMLHELGHFVTAKWSGMKATEFFVGFGPRLWSIKRGETEYGFKALPLGGYVRILGMTSMEALDPSDEPRSFVNQSTPKRVLVASAGSIVHLLIAVVLAFVALFWFGQPSPRPYQQIAGFYSDTSAPSAAKLAGLRVDDEILRIDGQTATAGALTSIVGRSADKPVTLLIRRGTRDFTITATPQASTTDPTKGYLGIEFDTPNYIAHPGLTSSVTGTGTLVWQVVDGTVHAFGSAFSPAGLSSLAHQVTNSKAAAAARAHGVGTVSTLGALILGVDAAHAGVLPFLGLLIALNISLGLLNMLPMLPLDGGHVAIALYERIRTRRGRAPYRADVSKLVPFAYAFMAFLLLFVAGKMYLDASHGVPNPFR